VLGGFTLKLIRKITDDLIDAGLLASDPADEYHRLNISAAGRRALASGEEITRNPLHAAPPRRPSPGIGETDFAGGVERDGARYLPGRDTDGWGQASGPAKPGVDASDAGPDEDDRFERLRAWRLVEARRIERPPFWIFSDSTLRAIARANPYDLSQMELIPGIGPKKMAAFGEAVLGLLHD
jgi:superfamily II DNA helicase RecQ